jgi:hypothetical protein
MSKHQVDNHMHVQWHKFVRWFDRSTMCRYIRLSFYFLRHEMLHSH